MVRTIFIIVLIVVVVIQFFRPQKNQSREESKSITTVYTIPANVQPLLEQACYDCHSNYTSYPWYDRIQPVAWWLQHHVNDGKKELNFSEFAGYTPKRQAHKLKEVAEQVEKGEMPITSYTWMHPKARLTNDQKQLIINWAKGLQAQIEQKGI
ncbi:MAG TPA: heme-binding domain-containing protein [Flavipsychrobacter sp.]|jgi:hypothetical protein|nr:heme-binding domain-containing protein [Flavipsychrobacter sp.]